MTSRNRFQGSRPGSVDFTTRNFELRNESGRWIGGEVALGEFEPWPGCAESGSLRILHLIPSLDATNEGVSLAVAEIAAMNAEDGMLPTIAFGAPEGAVEETELVWAAQYPNVVFRGFPYSFPSRFEASAALIEWLTNHVHEFDMMHAHSAYSLMSLQACSIAISADLPYAIRSLGSMDPHDLTKKSSVKYHVFASWVERILNGARFIQCTGSRDEASIEKLAARPATRILPLPARTPETKGDRARFRQSLGIPEEAFVFLFLSRIDGTKGIELLLSAMVQLAAEYPDARLIIAGTGNDTFAREMAGLYGKSLLGGCIHFASSVSGETKADLFAGSDCYVLPARFENLGASVVEALSHGLPALVSEQVHIWEEIVEARAGWVCKCSSQSLVAAMKGILKDRSGLAVTASWARSLARDFEPQNLRPLYRAAYEAAAV